MKINFNLKSNLKESWNYYKNNFVQFLIVTIIISIATIYQGEDNINGVLLLLSLLSAISYYFLINGILNGISDNEFEPFKKGDLPKFRNIWNFIKTYIGSGFLMGIFMIIPMVIFIAALYGSFLPGMIASFIIGIALAIYVLGRLNFSIFYSIKENIGLFRSIKKSWKLSENIGWKIGLYSLFFSIIGLSGFIVFGIGSIITIPIGFILMSKLFKHIHELKYNSKQKTNNENGEIDVEIVETIEIEKI